MRKNLNPELLTPAFVDGLVKQLEKEHANRIKSPDVLTVLCAELKIIVPILTFLKAGLFWKKNWKIKLENLIKKIETLCT